MAGKFTHPSRRAFLLGAGRARPEPQQQAPQRPPWSLAESAFLDTCTGCGDCIAACPEGILVADARAMPMVDFSRGQTESGGACTFCGRCGDACTTGTLLTAEARRETTAWRFVAVIGDACLTRQAIMCQSCKDACGDGAIRFTYQSGRVAAPVIDPKKCTGCGACQAPCPARAVSFRHLAVPQGEMADAG
jgi:ferredoxin-type protein NapF